MHILNSSDYLQSLRDLAQIRVHLVCLGNICRSPMANAVLGDKTSNLTNPKVLVDSSGTGPWHVGQGATQLSQQVWQAAGYEYAHIAKQFNKTYFKNYDLILTMDLSNWQTVLKLAKSDEEKMKVFMFTSFDPKNAQINPESSDAHLLSVPDPYGLELIEYQKVLSMVEQAADGFVNWVIS